MIVEICANSFASALAAQNSGADRIELCKNLSVGGLTPSRELIEKVIRELHIPVHILIRPRGGDFCYSGAELNGMFRDIAFCKQLSCAGIVSGVLTVENEIDISATKQLMAASEGMEFTFHRAFDFCGDPSQGINSLLQLGVSRLLSSGLQTRAVDGIELLKEIKQQVKGQIQIMPGGGINSENVFVFKEAGFEMIHLSATKKELSQAGENGFFNARILGDSDQEEIERIIKILS